MVPSFMCSAKTTVLVSSFEYGAGMQLTVSGIPVLLDIHEFFIFIA
jgi:hypothetical protein